jgi:NAD(P)H-hydrate epimerase
MNLARGVRVAVDLPSGLSADTGRPLGIAVAAEHTVTLGFPKVGVASWPGAERAGLLHVADIGIPRMLADRQKIRLHLLERSDVADLLPPRSMGGHKGTYGHTLLIAGSHGKSGAALLCSRGALRGGAGLVTVAATRTTLRALEGRVMEAMCAELAPDDAALGSETRIDDLLEGKASVCVGPGIPRTLGMQMLVLSLLEVSTVPMVLDADALNLIAEAGDAGRRALRGAAGRVLLTPHPGEAARLLGKDVTHVQADRVAAARELAAQTGAFVALKGARTVIAEPDGAAVLNPTGTPAMASGGVGDVLTGLCGALLAQRLSPKAALRLAVYVHGHAGEIAAFAKPVGLLASEVADAIPKAFRMLWKSGPG